MSSTSATPRLRSCEASSLTSGESATVFVMIAFDGSALYDLKLFGYALSLSASMSSSAYGLRFDKLSTHGFRFDKLSAQLNLPVSNFGCFPWRRDEANYFQRGPRRVPAKL